MYNVNATSYMNMMYYMYPAPVGAYLCAGVLSESKLYGTFVIVLMPERL